jgi:subtilisin family serine protease
VLSNSGSSVGSSVLAGMNWAVANRFPVVSMSLGADVNQVSQAFEQAGRRALQAGCLIIAAAGNNAHRSAGNFGFVGQPANSPSIMAVAAVDSQLRVAEFSARSSATTGTGGKVDIAAPGVAVFSSVPVNRGRHAVFNGTSMATPHVSGIAALWCQLTGRRGANLWTTLIQNVRSIPGDVRDVGSGLVQAPQ